WSELGLRVLYGALVAMALVFAAVGFYQYQTRDIFQNPKVINSNAYAQFFRVNSVFWDPSVYGRFLVVALVPSLPLLVHARVRRAKAHPLAGVGVGGFKRAYADRVQKFKGKDPKLAASHTTPVTVAAEGGLIGLLLCLWLLAALLLQAFRRADRSPVGTVALS